MKRRSSERAGSIYASADAPNILSMSLRSTARTRFLLDCRFSPVGCSLLFLQCLLRALVRWGRRNIAIDCGGIRRFGQTAGSILLGEFRHAIFQSLDRKST